MPTPSPFCLQLAVLSSWPGPSWQALAGAQEVQSLPGLTVLTIEAVVPTLCQVPACKRKGESALRDIALYRDHGEPDLPASQSPFVDPEQNEG